jgi:catechol 2,3-dioxygenase-like lactoylglutathione lyase family enzyme
VGNSFLLAYCQAKPVDIGARDLRLRARVSHASFLPHDDPDASLAFYRDTLGFEVRADVGSGKMRWITVGPPGQPGTSILLAPPATDPGTTDDERRTSPR